MLKRKNIIATTAAIVSLLLICSSCQTTKDEEPSVDGYTTKVEITENDEVETITESEIETEINAEADEVSVVEEEEPSDADSDVYIDDETQATTTTKKKNPVKNFFTFGNKDDFIRMDETTKVITKEMKGLTEKEAELVIRTDSDMAGFGFSIMGAYYIIQMDAPARKQLAKNAKRYFDDFENKRLIRNKKSTLKAYGSIPYQLNWGTFSSSTPNNGKGSGNCGYEFVKNQPYFTIFNYAFPNDYYEKAGDATTRESASVKVYFTRAQLKSLIEALSDENLSQYY